MTTVPGITLTGQATIQGTALFAPLSLTLDAGQWTCLLGGSGVGKSTLLRLICGLPTGAEFSGDIHASDGGEVSSRVAYMAQDDLLMPWATVSQNILLGATLRGDPRDHHRLTQILDRVGLTDHAAKKPSALSGGQRQRVALARTLMEDKPVILLDEPFSALDAQTRAAMQDLSAEVLDGKTVLIVTHDPIEAARLGDNIQIMSAEGLTTVAPPTGPIPRPVTSLDVLKTQADLLTRLRKVPT